MAKTKPKPKKPPFERFASTEEEIAVFFGAKSRNTVKDWKKHGLPGLPGRYPLGEIARWLRNHGPWRAKPAPMVDPMMDVAGSDSPNLERYRKAKAELAELDLAQRRGELVPADDVHRVYGIIAARYRDAGDQLQREYGPTALDIVTEAISDARREIEALFAQAENGDTSDTEQPDAATVGA